jgi:anti-sigma factor RsiW
MIQCDECRPLISRLMDGELPPESIPEVEAHVRSCASCAGYARELNALDGALESIPEPDMPLSLQLNLRALERKDFSRSWWPELKRAAVYTAAAGAVFTAGEQFPGAIELFAKLAVMTGGYFLLISSSLHPARGDGA